MKKSIEVTPQEAGQRVDVYVAQTLGLSRNTVKRLLAAGAIRSRGRALSKGQTLERGTLLEVDLRLTQGQLIANPALPLRVLFEDEALLILDKPSGLACHPLRADETNTLANALVARYPLQVGASCHPLEAGLCHRLDQETSGLLMAARNLQIYRHMRKAFSERQVYKRYLCLCLGGETLPPRGVVSSPLRQAGKRSKVASAENPKARPAHTRFRLLERQGAYGLLSVEIATGVMHQIRAHLASEGAPLVGDERYGPGKSPHCPRLFLHAAELRFLHPLTQQRLCFEAPLPQELCTVLKRLGFS